MTLADQVERGQQAAALLKNTMLAEAFDGVAKEIHERWESCPVRDHEGAHELKLMLKLLIDVKSMLELAISDGSAALKEIEFREKKILSPAQWSGR